jgi:hypothetical protein
MHIGKLINLRITQVGITKAEFARRINKTPQNITDLLLRSSMDTALLAIIGNVLGYNFFKVFNNYPDAIKELQKKGTFAQADDISQIWDALELMKTELKDLKIEISVLKRRFDNK